MVDLLLVNPPAPRHVGQTMEHLGLGYLAAAARNRGVSVELVNAPTEDLDFAELTTRVLDKSFKVIGVSILFQDHLARVLDWLESLRAAGLKAHMTIGGHPATFTYREILAAYDCIDSIVIGEGEQTLVELTENLIGGTDWQAVPGLAYRRDGEIAKTDPRPLVDNLDSLAWPARDALAARPSAFEQVSISASRGCHRFCSFCSIATFYRSLKGRVWRRRDPNDVLDEIDAARKLLRAECVFFTDDSFIGPGRVGVEQAYEFAAAMAARQVDYKIAVSCRADQVERDLFKTLKAAGLGLVFLGIESGNEEALDLFDKKSSVEINKAAIAILRELDILVEIGFIMFHPYTTFRQIKEDLDFLLETNCGPDMRSLSHLGLFPGQPLISRLKTDNLLRGTPFNYQANYKDIRIYEFREALGAILFDPAHIPAFGRGESLKQTAVSGVGVADRQEIHDAKRSLGDWRRNIYDLVFSGAELFEANCEDGKSLDKLKARFCAGCRKLVAEQTAVGLRA